MAALLIEKFAFAGHPVGGYLFLDSQTYEVHTQETSETPSLVIYLVQLKMWQVAGLACTATQGLFTALTKPAKPKMQPPIQQRKGNCN